MRKIIFIVAISSLLAGCYSPEQLAAARQAQVDADSQTCASYGLRPGSDAFGNCRLQLDIARQQAYYYDQPRFYGGFGYRHW